MTGPVRSVLSNFGRPTDVSQLSARVIHRFQGDFPQEFMGDILSRKPKVLCFGEAHILNQKVEGVKQASLRFAGHMMPLLRDNGYGTLLYEQLNYGKSIDGELIAAQLRRRPEITSDFHQELATFIKEAQRLAKDKEGLAAIVLMAVFQQLHLEGIHPATDSIDFVLSLPTCGKLIRNNYLLKICELLDQGRPVVTYGGGFHTFFRPPTEIRDHSFTRKLPKEIQFETACFDLVVPEYSSWGNGSHYENFARFYSDPTTGTVLLYDQNQYAIIFPGTFTAKTTP